MDKDGLSDSYEEKIGTEPFLSDTDGDGLSDGLEVGKNLDKPLNHDNDKRIDALDLDDDNDGLPTILELKLGANLDTDKDGIKNYLDDDSDNDGTKDGVEAGMLGQDSNYDRIDDAFDSQVKGKGKESVEDKNGDGIADDVVMPDHNKDGIVDMLDKNFQFNKTEGVITKTISENRIEITKKTTVDNKNQKIESELVSKLQSKKQVSDSKSEESEKITTNSNSKTGLSHSKTLVKEGLSKDKKLKQAQAKTKHSKKTKSKNSLTSKTDSDNDGLLDSQEIIFGTNPKKRDSDDDKVSDAIEIGIDPKVAQDSDHDGKIDALDSDDDNDGILTRNEDINKDGSPVNDDTDDDGVPNYLDANDDGDSMLTLAEGGRLDSDKDGILDYLDADDAVKYKREEKVVVLHDSNQDDFDKSTLSTETQLKEKTAEDTDYSQQDNRVTQALEQAIAHNQTKNNPVKTSGAQKNRSYVRIEHSPEGKLAKKKQVPLRRTEKGFIPWLTSLLQN
ncbi:hypothetical protein GQR58_003184 [Nymphon striatum]|nr:hypothetical protein GQR58_003184 [Nymphon striatum]